MDLREAQQLEGVTIIDPRANRNRRLIVAALSVAAIGVLGWIVFGQPTDKSVPPPAAAVPPTATPAAPAPAPAAPAPAASVADGAARQAAGTITGDAPKQLPAIRLAVPPSSAPAAAEAATPSAAAAGSSPAAGAPAGVGPTSAPGLKLDTEFASAKRIVPFAFNKVGVGPLGTLAVKELAPLAKQADKVYVRGRTDALGKPGANRKLALDRARTVYGAFLREGVQQEKMRLTYCTTCFVALNNTEEGRRANRRVEVELIMPRDEIAKLPTPVYAPEAPPPLLPSQMLRTVPR